MEDIDFARIARDRGEFVSEEKVKELIASGELFKRYELTESGISPRALPGQEGAVHLALSYEHDELGYEMDEPTMRVKQVDKRDAQDEHVRSRTSSPATKARPIPTCSSSAGARPWRQLAEVLERAEDNGEKVGPAAGDRSLPVPEPTPSGRRLKSPKRVLVVENNSTGQLAQMISSGSATTTGSRRA